MKKISFNIPSLGCSECSEKIRDTIKSVSGVESLTVNLKSQQLDIEYDSSVIDPDTIKNTISEMGYDIN